MAKLTNRQMRIARGARLGAKVAAANTNTQRRVYGGTAVQPVTSNVERVTVPAGRTVRTRV